MGEVRARTSARRRFPTDPLRRGFAGSPYPRSSIENRQWRELRDGNALMEVKSLRFSSRATFDAAVAALKAAGIEFVPS